MVTKHGSLVLLVACIGAVHAEDWPTLMHDNQRTGRTAESLRPPLQLNWVFESPSPPAPGWALPVNGYGARKNKPNVSHDDAYRVIAVAGTCYFCSSAENRIFAVDAATGTVRWSVFTEAAPRLAPAFWQGRLYVGADDGVFRCLDAQSGELQWQIRAAPRDGVVLGLGRFHSAWPIRAAGIVEDGVAYFTAGLFPSQGLFFYAVDVEDGSVRWCRQLDDGGRLDHVPQGYMLAMQESIWTTSRTAPARWHRHDGHRIDFQTPFPQVPGAHEYRFYNGGTYAQILDGRNIVYGQACLLGYDPDREFQDRWGRTQKGKLVFHWFNARQAVFRDNMAYVATDDHLLAVRQDRLPSLSEHECRELEETYKRLRVASYLDHQDRYDTLVRRFGEDDARAVALKQGPLRWGADNWQAWQQASPTLYDRFRRRCAWMTPLKTTEALIVAGNVIYGGSDDRVTAVDAGNGRLLWEFETGSRVRGLAVANGCLYVSTVDGTVRCFATSNKQHPETHRVARGKVSPPATGEPPTSSAQLAKQIVAQTGVTKGYGLIVGADSADLAVELAALTELHIEMLVADNARARQLREDLVTRDVCANRVCVRQGAPSELPYPPYVFNLVIDQGSFSGETSAGIHDYWHVVKPCGGVLVMRAPSDLGRLEANLNSLEPGGGAVRRIDQWLTVTRGRIPSAADWTHNYANPANTYCSGDPHVKGPFGLLWYGEPGPRKRIDRHATPPMPLVVNGVVFTIGYDLVLAYDAYNGISYWERELPGASRQGLPINTSNLAADRRSLFIVCSDGICRRLDARTGETAQTYTLPSSGDGPSSGWAWIATEGDSLFGSRAEFDETRRRAHEQTSGTVFALDKNSGKRMWMYQGRGIDHDGIAIADGRVFLTDRALSEVEQEQARAGFPKDGTVPDRRPIDRRGQPIPRDVRKIVALDASRGQTIWQRPLDVTDITLDDVAVLGRSGVACMVKDNVLIVHGVGSLGHPHKEFLAGEFERRALYAFDAATGRPLWGGRKGYRKRPIIVGDYVYAEPFAWHLKSGAQKVIRNPLSNQSQPLDFHRGYIGCGHVVASATTLFGAKGGIGYCNLGNPSGFIPFDGVAMACGVCAVPAAGVFVVPEGRSGCTCDVPIHTSLTLYPRPHAAAWGVGHAGGRAEVTSLPVQHVCVNLGGPGYRQDSRGNLWIPYPARVAHGLLGDWLPTYQHDASMCYRMDEPGVNVTGTDAPWIYASGYAHEKPLRFRLIDDAQPPATYTIKLFFAEPKEIEVGQRIFSVQLQGKTVLPDFDVVAQAKGARRSVVKEFPGIVVQGELEIRLIPADHTTVAEPLLCGFEARREPP